MTVQDAADILGVSASRVYAMCRDGVPDSRKLGNAVMVSAADVTSQGYVALLATGGLGLVFTGSKRR